MSTHSMDEEQRERYERAQKRVKEIKEFYEHVMIYVLVIGFLAIINLLTSPGFPWVLFPAGGWGIGLAFHALSVWQGGILGRNWEERKIRELMAKDAGEKVKNEHHEHYEDYFVE